MGEEKLHSALYTAIRSLPVGEIGEEDNRELLDLFLVTRNTLIRDWIAMIFADTQFHEAVPYIIQKINDPKSRGNTGTLVHALGDLDCKEYFLDIVNVICTQAYEPSLWAYDIVEEYADDISYPTRLQALQLLENARPAAEAASGNDADKKLEFINGAVELLKQ
jgi:hypothetical protein